MLKVSEDGLISFFDGRDSEQEDLGHLTVASCASFSRVERDMWARRCSKRSCARGTSCRVLVRTAGSAERLTARGLRAVVGNVGRPDTWRRVAAGHDAFVHAAFDYGGRGVEVDSAAIDALIETAQQTRDTALIYTSGAWLIGSSSEPVDENVTPNPTPIAAYRPAHEARVLAAHRAGLRTMVVRPGVVYGGGRGIITDFLRDAENGLIRVIGSGGNHWATVYDRDVGDLYARLLATPDAAGVYHATDESGETVNEMVEAIAAQAPSSPDVRHVPIAEARQKLGALADALALDQRVRSPRARALGWSPSLPSITRSLPRLFEEWRNARRAAT